MCQPTVIALKTVNTPHSKCRRKHCLQHDWHLDKVNWTYVDTPSRDCILNTRQIQDRNKQFVHPSSHSYQQQKHVQWMAQSSLCSWQTLLSTSRRKIRLQCADILWSFDLTRQVTDWHSQLNLLDLAQHSLTRLQRQPCDSCEIAKLCLRITQTLACTLSKLWKTCK